MTTFEKLLVILCWTQVVLVTGQWPEKKVTPNKNDGHAGGATCSQGGECCLECCSSLYSAAPGTCQNATGIARCLDSCEWWLQWVADSSDGDEDTAGSELPTRAPVFSATTHVPTSAPTRVRTSTPTTSVAPSRLPSLAPSLEPLSVERPTVVGDVTPVCLDDDTEGYAVNVTVLGAGGIGGTRTVPIEVVFVLDSSGSMANTDPSGHRQAAAIEFVNSLIPALDYAAVASFDDKIDFNTSLTNEFDGLRKKIADVDAVGGTNLDIGLRQAVSILQESQLPAATRAIIFLTDGAGAYTYCANGGPALDAANNGYKVYSVGLSRAAESAPLIDMAQCTGATYTSAIDGVDLTNIFQDFFGEVLESTAPLNVTLSLVLQPGFSVVAGSQSPQPDSRYVNSGRTTMVWESVDNGLGLAEGDSFKVNFDVTATTSGPLTDQLDSKVTFFTPEGNTGEVQTPNLFIDIENAPGVC